MSSRLAKFRRLTGEQLQRRELMAGDLAVAAIQLETLNSAGKPVTHVAVGEQFTLRASAKDLRNTGGVFAAFVDVTFNGDLVQPSQSLEHSGLLTNVLSGSVHSNRIEDAGSVGPGTITPDNSKWMNVVLWEATFTASADGEVVFASNPTENEHHEVLLLGLSRAIVPQEISFGFTRLLVGNGQPSPWTNPQNPADVNQDGVVTQADVDVLESLMSTSNSLPLPLSASTLNALTPNASTQTTQLVDVDADRSLTATDLQLVRDQITKKTIKVDPTPQPPTDWSVDNFSFTVTNLRTGLTTGEVAEGDVLDVAAHFNAPTEPDKIMQVITSMRAIATGTTPFKFDQAILTQITQAAIEFDKGISSAPSRNFAPATLSTRLIAKASGQTFLGIDSSVFPVVDAVTSAANSYWLSVSSGGTRPVALPVQVTLPFNSWTVADTAQVVKAEGRVVAKLDAAKGILANNADAQNIRTLLISDAKLGHVELNNDGSFTYSPTLSLQGNDSFEYVTISRAGTSNPQTVQLHGSYPALVDVNINFTNALGEKIDRVKRGATFFVDVSASSVLLPDTDSGQPLRADLKVGSINARGASIPNHVFDTQYLALATDANGKLALTNEIASTTALTSTNALSINAAGFDLFRASERVASLVRIPIAAQSIGSIDWQRNSLTVGNLPKDAIHLLVAKLEVIESDFRHNVEVPLDVNSDGVISPMDALLGINLLNHRSSLPGAVSTKTATAVDSYFYDTNGDGDHSPIDVLLIINALNARSNGEGEQVQAASLPATDLVLGAASSEENPLSATKRKSRR